MAKSKSTTVTPNTDETPIRDIDLSIIARQRFRLNGDNSKIIELNTSDLGIIARAQEADEKLEVLTEKVNTLSTELMDTKTDEEAIILIGQNLKDIDNEMRELIDYMFDSPVSDVCAEGGTMYDPIGGKPRYMHIIDKLSSLYADDLKHEMNQISAKAKQRMSKYTRK